MRRLSSAAFLFICASVTAQQYNIGHTSADVRDSHRGNRKIRVEIYYPERQENTVLREDEACPERFPVICFAHGYVMSPDLYGNIGEALVPEGYILAFPYSETGMFPSHQALSEDLALILAETERMGSKTGSPLYGIVDTTSCLMGHSMGGGALFAAANIHAGIDAIVSLAPMNTKPSAIQAAASVEAPTLIIGGENDCITPPDMYQIPIYNFSASADKTFILIRGGTHCAMADSSRVCTLAEKFSGCNEGIAAKEQHQILKKYLIPWLDYFLKGDMENGKLFDMTITGDRGVDYMRSRPLITGADQKLP